MAEKAARKLATYLVWFELYLSKKTVQKRVY